MLTQTRHSVDGLKGGEGRTPADLLGDAWRIVLVLLLAVGAVIGG